MAPLITSFTLNYLQRILDKLEEKSLLLLNPLRVTRIVCLLVKWGKNICIKEMPTIISFSHSTRRKSFKSKTELSWLIWKRLCIDLNNSKEIRIKNCLNLHHSLTLVMITFALLHPIGNCSQDKEYWSRSVLDLPPVLLIPNLGLKLKYITQLKIWARRSR